MRRSLQLNPNNRPADWTAIRDWREAHKRSPVTTSFGVFDADNEADVNFQGMIKQFYNLTTLDAQNRLMWKRADNSFMPLSKVDLEAVYAEVETGRAVRGAILHVKAEVFNMQDPKPTPSQLKDISFWIT